MRPLRPLAALLALALVAGVAAGCGPEPSGGEKIAGADDAPAPGQPRPEMPAPPPPAPALNRYADECLGGELPGEEAELRALTAGCFENLLETLRAAIGTGELPQAVVGPRLDETEVAVRHLSIEVADDDLPARVRTAAVALVDLAASIGEALPGSPAQGAEGAAAEAAARAAAEGIDPATPLSGQSGALAAFLRTADGQVRPLVRFLSRRPDAGAGAPPAGPPGDAAPGAPATGM